MADAVRIVVEPVDGLSDVFLEPLDRHSGDSVIVADGGSLFIRLDEETRVYAPGVWRTVSTIVVRDPGGLRG